MPCDARSFCDLFKRKGPTQRLKTAKKSFLRPLWTPNPNFWYLIFSQFFFSSKYGHVGCPEQCHVIPGLSATLSNAREPTQRLKTAKKSILWPFRTQNPNFSAVLSCWVGPLGLSCDVWALRNLFKPKGPNQWLIMAKKLGLKVQNDRKNDFFAVLNMHLCKYPNFGSMDQILAPGTKFWPNLSNS